MFAKFIRVRSLIFAALPVHSQDGQSAVEFALVLPILLIVVMGIFSFGIAFNQYILLTEATSVGARQLAISRGNTLDPCSTVSSVVQAAAPLLNSSQLSYSIVLNGTTYTSTSCSSSSTTTGAAGNLKQGSNASVTVNYPCSIQVWGKNLVSNCHLYAETTEVIQ